MNLQWMKTKIPQALMTPEIDVECWTFLHPLDAAHATLMGFFPKQTLQKLKPLCIRMLLTIVNELCCTSGQLAWMLVPVLIFIGV